MLRIARSLVQQVISHCQSCYPKEACGLLAADASGKVAGAYPMRNVEDSPIGYSLDPREQLAVERQMRQKSQKLAAIFHSHTASAAYPSPVDVRLAISPDVSYVLVSLKDQAKPDFRSFHIDGQTVTEEPVNVDD